MHDGPSKLTGRHRSLGPRFAITLSACGGGSSNSDQAGPAKAAVNAFGRTEDCRLLTARARDELSGQASVAGCQKVLDRGVKPRYTIRSATVSGATATVVVTGASGTYTITVTRSSKAWLMDFVKQSGG